MPTFPHELIERFLSVEESSTLGIEMRGVDIIQKRLTLSLTYLKGFDPATAVPFFQLPGDRSIFLGYLKTELH